MFRIQYNGRGQVLQVAERAAVGRRRGSPYRRFAPLPPEGEAPPPERGGAAKRRQRVQAARARARNGFEDQRTKMKMMEEL